MARFFLACLVALFSLSAGALAQEPDLSETPVPYDELTGKVKEITDYLQQKEDGALGIKRPVFVPGQPYRPTPIAVSTPAQMALQRRVPKILADFYGANIAPVRSSWLNIVTYRMPVSRADLNKLEAAYAQLKAYESTLTALTSNEDAIVNQEEAVFAKILAVHAAESKLMQHYSPLLMKYSPDRAAIQSQYDATMEAAGAPLSGLFKQLGALDERDVVLSKSYQRKIFLTEIPAFHEGGSKVTPMVDGPEIFKRVDELLHDVADHGGKAGYVHISLWHCSESTKLTPNESFLQAMRQVILSGAEVRLTLWDAGNATWINFDNTEEENKECADTLMQMAGRAPGQGNVHVEFLKHKAIKGSFHQKYFIFNNGTQSRAIVGGLNLDTAQDASTNHVRSHSPTFDDVHDVAIEIDGPAVDDVEEDFNAHWYAFWDDNKTSVSLHPLTHMTLGKDDVRIAVTNPVSAHTPVQYEPPSSKPRTFFFSPPYNIRGELIQNISQAKNFIYLENYAIFDPQVITAIGKRIAEQRIAGKPLQVIILARHVEGAELYDYLHYITYEHLSFMTCDQFQYGDDEGVTHWVDRRVSGKKVWSVDYKGDFYQDTVVRWDNGSAKLTSIIAYDHDQPLYTLVSYQRKNRNILAQTVWIHSKVSIFDDEVAGVGSANFNTRSMQTDGELTAFVRGPAAAVLRKKLWTEYFGTAPSPSQWAIQAETNRKLIPNLSLGKLYVLPLRPPAFSRDTLKAWESGAVKTVIRNATWAEDY